MNQTPGQFGEGKSFHQFFHFLCKCCSTFTKTSLQNYFSLSLSARQKYPVNVHYFLCNSLLLLLHVYSTNVELCMYITTVIVMLAENTKHIPFASRKLYRFSSKKIIRCNDPPNLPPSHLSGHFELQYSARCLFVLILWLGD